MSQTAVKELLSIAADNMVQPPTSRWSLFFTIVHAVLALLLAGALDAFAQTTPGTASLTRWDIHAVTGGTTAPTEGTHKLSGIARDSRGDLWVIGQGNGHVRVGRIDTTSPAGDTYTEWKVFNYGDDGEPRGLLVTADDDVWLAVDGAVPFVRKRADSNAFIDFRRDNARRFSPLAMTLAPDGSRIFVAGAEQSGQGYIVTIDTTLGAGVDVTLPAWTAPSGERDRFQPQYVAVDGAPGVVWFSNSGDPLHPVSTLGRLDTTTGHVLEWRLNGLAAAGLDVDASRVCVVTRGSLAQPPIPPGDVECLAIPADNPATPENEMATTPATRRRFSRSAAGALDLPEQIAGGAAAGGGASSLFVTERGGNAVAFIGAAAMAAVVADHVMPASLELESAGLGGFTVVDDWEGPNEPRLTVPLPSTPVSIAGTVIGTGQARFEFPPTPQETPESLVRYPHPSAMTPVYYPVDSGGYGTVYVAESFHDLRGDTYLAARVDKFELPVPVLRVTDASGHPVSRVSFSADLEDTTAPSEGLTVGIGGTGSLDWSSSAAATGFSMTLAPITSGVVSDTQSDSVTLTPTIPASPGSFSGALTISSSSASQAVIIPVTMTVTGPPVLTADRTQLTFQTNGLLSPSDTVRLTNAPYRRAIRWAASGPSWLTIGPAGGTLAGGQDADVTMTVNPAELSVDGPHTADVTFFDAANPLAADTRVVVKVTVTVMAPSQPGDLAIAPAQLTFDASRWARCNGSWSGSNPASQSLVVTNDTDHVTWFLGMSGDSWLAADRSWGVVPPGTTKTLSVSIDAKGLPRGVFTGKLTVHTLTDPSERRILESHVVPVTVKVGPAPARLCVSPASLDFGSLKENTLSAAKTITVENVGDSDLAWSATGTASNGSVTLAKSGSTLRVVVKAGTKTGAQTGKVTISAPGAPPQIVNLTWSVAEKKGGSHDHDHDRDHHQGKDRDHDDKDRCHGDHDRDGDHDDDDHERHRHGHDRD